MKRVIVVMLLLVAIKEVQAQHVRVRLNFPVGVRIGAPGPSPYRGSVWIGPEWRWQSGQYVSVPGYWARPGRYNAVWVPGHWKYSRRGYRWVPGRWR
jgi:hypothetical protein